MQQMLASTEPWGKLDRRHPDRASAPRLSLVGHSIDVAAVCRSLLELPTWRRRLERLACRVFGPLDLDRLTVLAFWHDVGKAGAGFQAKGASPETESAWRQGTDGRQGSHTSVIAPLLDNDARYLPHRVSGGQEARFFGGEAAFCR